MRREECEVEFFNRKPLKLPDQPQLSHAPAGISSGRKMLPRGTGVATTKAEPEPARTAQARSSCQPPARCARAHTDAQPPARASSRPSHMEGPRRRLLLIGGRNLLRARGRPFRRRDVSLQIPKPSFCILLHPRVSCRIPRKMHYKPGSIKNTSKCRRAGGVRVRVQDAVRGSWLPKPSGGRKRRARTTAALSVSRASTGMPRSPG